MSDTIYKAPGATFYSELDSAPTGLVGTLGVQIIRKGDGGVVLARTTSGIVEAPAESGRYVFTGTAPTVKGSYTVLWDTGTVTPATTATDDLEVTSNPIAPIETGPLYASPASLRAFLKVNEEVLPDEEAETLLAQACDLIDERLGNRPVDEDTGRKVVPEEEDAWRVKKLAEATIEVAAVIFNDPGVASRQRVRSVSGDVSTSSPYGPAFGERAQVLLNASGLANPFARVGRRRGRAALAADRFFDRS